MYSDIITDIKKILGIPKHVADFDDAIIMHCNTVISALTQMGIGPKEGYELYDGTETWDDITGDHKIQNVKTYVGLKVKLLFDPPSNATLIDSINSQLNEIEWRMRIEVDSPNKSEDSVNQVNNKYW